MVESFPSDILQTTVSYLAESRLESCQTSTLELLCESRGLFRKKSSTADVRLDFKCTFDWRCCKCGVALDCKCMEFVAADWCTVKHLRVDQTVRNLTCGDWTGSNRTVKDQVCVTPGFVWGNRGPRGRRGGVISCVWSTVDWASDGSIDVFSCLVSVVLVLRGVGPILGNEYGI